MNVSPWVWAATIVVVVAALALDLLVFHRRAHAVSLREAAWSSAAWVSLGVVFGVVVWVFGGSTAGGEYFAGYLIEKALSVENIFVFALILAYFAVPKALQHRVLFYGVLGALVLRAIFIGVGAAVLDRFSVAMYAFGAFVLVSAWRMLRHGEVEVDPERNPVLRWMRRVVPMTDDYRGQRMWVREPQPHGPPRAGDSAVAVNRVPEPQAHGPRGAGAPAVAVNRVPEPQAHGPRGAGAPAVAANRVPEPQAHGPRGAGAPAVAANRVNAGRWLATPLLAVLVVIETSDVVFAIDSIPAIFAVTDDSYIVFASNAFAILGLRALYFLLAGAMRELHYLRQGLALVLAFVGTKMVLADVVHIPIAVSLAVIFAILAATVVASLGHARRAARRAALGGELASEAAELAS